LTVSVVTVALAICAGLATAEDQDALARAKSKNALTACADPYNYPFSSNSFDPPGFDVEIVRAIAQRGGMRAAFFWADTGTRGGLGRALRTSIMQKKCDFFIGLPIGGDSDEEMREKKLALTRPYLGLGYVLVVQGPVAGATRLEDLKKTKIGVPMSTPVDAYLFDNGYERGLYLRNREIIKAMVKGEIDAGLVWSPTLAQARTEFPAGAFRAVPGYTPEPALRWNVAIAVPKDEAAMKQFLDDSIGALLQNGKLKEIVERYGMPFFPPFE